MTERKMPRILFIDNSAEDANHLQESIPEICVHWARSIASGKEYLMSFGKFDLVLVDYNGTASLYGDFAKEVERVGLYKFTIVSASVVSIRGFDEIICKEDVVNYVRKKLGL